MLLSGGMWGTIDLTYDETEVHNKKIRPYENCCTTNLYARGCLFSAMILPVVT